MQYQIGKYVFKTTEKDNRIFWANDYFWDKWPKLAKLGLVYADSSKASPSNFGHVDIRVNLQKAEEYCVITSNHVPDPIPANEPYDFYPKPKPTGLIQIKNH